jgi:hypothetical protein
MSYYSSKFRFRCNQHHGSCIDTPSQHSCSERVVNNAYLERGVDTFVIPVEGESFWRQRMVIPLQREDFQRYRMVISTQRVRLVIFIETQGLRIPRQKVSVIDSHVLDHISMF